MSADLYHIEFFAKQKHIDFAEGKYIKPSSARHIDKGKERTSSPLKAQIQSTKG